MTLKRRLTALERLEPTELSPAVRAWLGQPVTPEERAALDAELPKPWSPPRRADLVGCSPQLLDWIGAI